MKKFFLLIIGLILILTIGMPYGIGFLLRQRYYDNISLWNANNRELEISGEFNIGIFTSTAKTIVKTKNNNRNNPMPISLELEHTIQNGPVIIDFEKYKIKEYKLALVETKICNQGFQSVNNQFYKDKQGLEIITAIEYAGDGITKIKNLPFTKDVANGQVEWGGADFTIKHDKTFTTLDYEMLMPKLSYKEEVNIIELQTITSKGNQHLAALGLWEGQGDFQFKQFGIKSNKDDVFIITGFKCNSIVDIKETIINFIFGWRIESIFELSSTTKAGPFALTISIDNINGEALHKIQEFGYVVRNDPTMADKVNAAWKNFFVNKMKVKVKNAEFNLPQGKLTVEADVNIGGSKLEAITPAIIMKTVDGVAKIEMPKALAYEIAAKKIEHDIILEAKDFDLSHEGEKMPKPYKLTLAGKKEEIEKRVLAEVKKLIDEKFIIEKDKTFFAEIKMKDGIIMVNEKPLPLGM